MHDGAHPDEWAARRGALNRSTCWTRFQDEDLTGALSPNVN